MKLYSPNFCFFAGAKFTSRNIIFNQRPIVIKEINSNSIKKCKSYYYKYNIHFARTTFTITVFILQSYFS